MKNLRHMFTLSAAVLGMHTGMTLSAQWTLASTGLIGSVAGAKSLVIDSTGSTLYVQTAGNGICKSTDGGVNWNLLGSILGVQVLALDPHSPSTIYAGTARGLLKSADGGQSWTAAGLAGTSVTILAVDPIAPSTLYAADALDDHIYKSTDGGESWTAFSVGLPAGNGIPPGPSPKISSLTLDSSAPSTLYVVASPFLSALFGSPLYKSTDGGQSWNVVNPGPFALFLAIDPVTPSTLYAAEEGFSKSVDGGATWTPIYVKDFDCTIQVPCRSIAALAIDPTNSNTLYASASAPNGTPPAIYKSTDGGQTWNLVNMTIPFAGSMVLNPANPSVIYLATYAGGMFESTDAAMSWSEANNGLRALGFGVLIGDPTNPATIYFGGDSGLFQSVDSGGSWNQKAAFQIAAAVPPPGFPPPPPGFLPPAASGSVQSLLIDFTKPNILYVGIHRTNGCSQSDILLYKSTDGGSTWSGSMTPQEGGFGSGCLADALMAMDPTDPNTVYLRWGDDYDGFGLRKSMDGGATWTFTGFGADALYALVIDPTNPATLYGGTDSGVVRSADGGATWTPVGLADENVSLLAIDPLHPNVLYAGVTGYYPDPPGFRGLFKSADSGASWSPINTGLGDLINAGVNGNALILDPDHPDVLSLGTSGYGVFKSSDGGATWAAFNEGLTHLDVRALAIVRGAPPTVYAGTPGGVFKIR